MSEIRSQATPVVDKARGELGVVIHNHVCVSNLEDCVGECYVAAAALQTAGWSKPRTVNSASELEALPVGSVVRVNDANDVISHVCLRYSDGWFTTLHESMVYPLAVTGSATVLFTPGDAG